MKELLNKRLRQWIATYLASENVDVVLDPFWVIPVGKDDPEYDALVANGLNLLKTTKIIDELFHESTIFILMEDGEGRKVCVTSTESALSKLNLSSENEDFHQSGLDFLQLAHLVTKFELPAINKIPIACVNASPVFQDDIIPYFPQIHILKLREFATPDRIDIVALKVLLELEGDTVYVKHFKDLILSVGYAVPSENHDWIIGQIFSAVRSQRIENFYLGIYKLFEFFFPLDSIFGLADKLKFVNSELVLLNYCRGELGWNVNHQRGSRAAASYAPVEFAEICLNETFAGEEDQLASFKAKAVEKLTSSRHALTHQDFKSTDLAKSELLNLTAGLLTFLRDAFTQYGTKVAERRKISQEGKPKNY